jgi:hypothetical protein
MTRPKQLTASTDRSLPAKYEGKLEPNHFCRGWNAKRKKYCRSRAGFRTQHPGIGRCCKHGGLSPAGDERVRTGSRSKVKSTTLEQLIEQEKERVDPLDLTEELATLRALRSDLRTRNPDAADHPSEIALVEAIGRLVERIERIRSANAISRPELNRIMHELWRAIDVRIQDEDLKSEIREDWMRIAL